MQSRRDVVTLEDGTSITNGTLSIASDGTLEIVYGSSNVGATLDNVSVSGSGAIQVGSTGNAVSSDPTLTLDDGTIITHGTLSIGSGDTLNIEAGPNNGLGATLDGVEVIGTDVTSMVRVGSESTLTLTNTTFSDVTFTFAGTGNTIDLTDVAYTSNEYVVWTQSTTANGGSGTLQLYSGTGAPESTFNLSGIYSQNEFSVGQDSTASNGTDLNFNNPNYVSFFNGTINTNGTYAPQVSNAGSAIELTNGDGGEAASWFASNKYSIANFTASFDYVATGGGGDPADGLAFILQNSGAGVHALGDSGGYLGYGANPDPKVRTTAAPRFLQARRSNSICTDFYGQGTAFETNGVTGNSGTLDDPIYQSTSPVGFWNGDAVACGRVLQRLRAHGDANRSHQWRDLHGKLHGRSCFGLGFWNRLCRLLGRHRRSELDADRQQFHLCSAADSFAIRRSLGVSDQRIVVQSGQLEQRRRPRCQ